MYNTAGLQRPETTRQQPLRIRKAQTRSFGTIKREILITQKTNKSLLQQTRKVPQLSLCICLVLSLRGPRRGPRGALEGPLWGPCGHLEPPSCSLLQRGEASKCFYCLLHFAAKLLRFQVSKHCSCGHGAPRPEEAPRSGGPPCL